MDELRREARRLEHGLDAEMVQFGRLDLSEPGLSSAFDVRGREIEAMLHRLQEVNDQMSRQASTATGSAASTMHVLQRHREILHDFMQEFAKTKSNLKSADERQQLLSSVRAAQPARPHPPSCVPDALAVVKALMMPFYCTGARGHHRASIRRKERERYVAQGAQRHPR